MAEKIIMPKQGLQMTSGTITDWLKKEGDEVKSGEPLFEIETDKLTITIDSSASGTLLKILHPAGDEVPITETIAYVGTPGESIPDLNEPQTSTEAKTAAEPSVEVPSRKYSYDVAVLGGGPGGYEAAIRCAQLGLKTVLIETRHLGGTCLNQGCIPTKALLACAQTYEAALNASAFGVSTGTVSIDYATCTSYKETIVSRLRNGIAALEKAHGVTVEHGFGTLTDPHTIQIDNTRSVTARHIILAVGSVPAKPPIPGIEGDHILTSDGLLALETLPESILIIGGGVIGVEFAALFAGLGKEVTILEMMPSLLTGTDREIVDALTGILKQKKVNIYTDAKVLSLQGSSSVSVTYQQNGREETLTAAYCLISTGREPATGGLGLEAAGIRTSRGYVEVDHQLRTSVPHIYAAGDFTGKVQLAHVATAQGLCAASNCAGRPKSMRYDIIPSCIYTSPEIASVGMTEQKAHENGRNYKTGVFPLNGNGKAMILGETRGLAKIISDTQTGEILGAHLMAPNASDMIGEIAAVMRCEGTIEELGDTIHPHPSVSEIILEAALDTQGLSCNKTPQKSERADDRNEC